MVPDRQGIPAPMGAEDCRVSCSLKCGNASCRNKAHEEIGDMLLQSGFSKFVEVKEPRFDVWMRGQSALVVEEQAILIGVDPKEGRVDVYLGLGTTLTPEHLTKLKDRLGAHLVQFL